MKNNNAITLYKPVYNINITSENEKVKEPLSSKRSASSSLNTNERIKVFANLIIDRLLDMQKENSQELTSKI